MNNTIRLLKNEIRLTKEEMRRFSMGDSIHGDSQTPEELKRWSINQKEEAEKELAKYRCSYVQDGQLTNINEYALEYSELDEDGDFVSGCDYDFADVQLFWSCANPVSEEEEKAIKKAVNYLNLAFDGFGVQECINHDILGIYNGDPLPRSKKSTVWYMDNDGLCSAVYVDTLEQLSDEEIEAEFC